MGGKVVGSCRSPAHLAQDDPHRGVGLDGQPDGFQRPEGWVHLALCDTLGEGAWWGEHRGDMGTGPWHPDPPKPRGDHEQPWQPPARSSPTQDGLKNQQRGHQYSAKCYTWGDEKNQLNKTKWGAFGYASHPVKDTSVQDHGMEASLISIVLARSQPVAMSHFFGCDFFFFKNATGRNQTACRGMLKWQKAMRAREFFFYLSI